MLFRRNLFKIAIDGGGWMGKEDSQKSARISESYCPALVVVEDLWTADAHVRSRTVLGPLGKPPPSPS